MEELSRFEKARVLGARSLQLSMGAPALVSTKGMSDPLEIAREEFEKNKIPITIIKE